MQARVLVIGLLLGAVSASSAAEPGQETAPPASAQAQDIKAYCLDFNWAPTHRRGRPFAQPGTWAAADPAAHVAWYQAMGANVIQTFCVSTNGYAWYKDGFIPEQPGLKHDFLPEVVKLGHQKGMLVFGYFCAAANPKWGADHPELSYGTPTTYHIPYTDEYLNYLSRSIGDAVRKTGIDGFMVDWLWMPKRDATQGKWLSCEKQLYEQLMGEPFPGEDKLTGEQDLAYSRKAIDRCWKAIRKAAKDANPNCVVWLTVNHMNHPHVVNSDMYRQADWLMNEAGSIHGIDQVKDMVGEHARLITCLARWNNQDATTVVPEALAAGVGLYGFTTPTRGDGLVPLEPIFARQVSELSGDARNIAVLARAYQGQSIDAVWQDGKFVEPDVPPPLRIRLKGRGRGLQDTASILHDQDQVAITITTPYGRGRALLVRTGTTWPSAITVRLQKRPGQRSEAALLRMANGALGLSATLDGTNKVTVGKLEGGLDLGREWGDQFLLAEASVSTDGPAVPVATNEEVVEIKAPAAMTATNPEILALQWETTK